MTGFESILCPVDPVAPSEVALQHAMALGKWSAGSVTVLAVRPHGWRAGRAPGTGRDGRRRGQDGAAFEDRIRQLATQPIRVQVVEGAIGREIVRAVSEHGPDVLVMGVRPLGRIERLLFGSVTEYVLMHTSAPVLIVPPGAGPPPSSPAALFERMVCGVDRSTESLQALAFALSLSKRHVAVVHALEDFSDEHPRFARHFNSVECWRAVEAELRADYEALVPEAARLWCEIEVAVPFGSAGRVLVDEAEARKASLLVIGTAGWHGSFGGTARYVIQKAPCPVLAVPRATNANSAALRTGGL